MPETKQTAESDELDYALNIGNINNGAIPELFAKLNAQIMDNIRDANTTPTKKRKMQITVTYAPSADRKSAQVMLDTKLTLAPPETTIGTIHIAKIKGKITGFVHDPAQDELRFGESASQQAQ